jgi:hypothetical protein
MNYPFEKDKKGHPILDTEEKLQWYMNRLLHREVDLFYVNAEARDLDTVWLRKRRCENLQSIPINSFIGTTPTFIEPNHYGCVDRSVVTVLRTIHARREAELEAKRKEDHEKRAEAAKAEVMKEGERRLNRMLRRIWD